MKTMANVKFLPNTTCSCCGSANLEQAFAMPNFPQIGLYRDSPDDSKFPRVDQALMVCADCGHIQLMNNVDPSFLYDETFTHRTSNSASASASNTAFANYVKQLGNGRRFKRIIEIGCNDAFLLRQLSEIGDLAVGIDPVWRGQESKFTEGLEPELAKKITCVGDFVENIDFETRIGGKPDLIVSSFVFEHIRDPRAVLRALFDVVDDDALFVIKVPGTDMLLDNCRFDQLSHQHYQQWTLDSFRKTIESAGGVYVAHTVLYRIWGAIMMAFKKGPGKGPSTSFRRADINLVRERKAIFDAHLKNAMLAVKAARPRKVYGLGAAQNFPSLAYFMGDNVDFFECILDDNPARTGKYYPGFPVQTRQPTKDMDIENSSIMITGPDYGRVLMRRASELNPEQIILPFASI
jgi:SAM-dependent methyltransferase